MENETSKKQRYTKRRERAQVNQIPDYGSGDDDPPVTKEKPRSKPRKKKNNSNLAEEDIIDGFAIMSFKTFEDLEVSSYSFIDQSCVACYILLQVSIWKILLFSIKYRLFHFPCNHDSKIHKQKLHSLSSPIDLFCFVYADNIIK